MPTAEKKIKKGQNARLAAVCAAILVLFLAIGLFAAFFPTVKAGAERSRTVRTLDGADTVLYAEPAEANEFVGYGAEAVLTAGADDPLCRELSELLKNARYVSAEKTFAGSFLPTLTAVTDEKTARVFLGEEEMLVETKDVTYRFRPKDGKRYEELKNALHALLREPAAIE